MLISKKNNHVDAASIEVRRLAREQQMVDLYRQSAQADEQQQTHYNGANGMSQQTSESKGEK